MQHFLHFSKPSPILKLDWVSAQRLLGNFEDKLWFWSYHFLALPCLKWIILFGYTRIYNTYCCAQIIKLTHICLICPMALEFMLILTKCWINMTKTSNNTIINVLSSKCLFPYFVNIPLKRKGEKIGFWRRLSGLMNYFPSNTVQNSCTILPSTPIQIIQAVMWGFSSDSWKRMSVCGCHRVCY